MREASDTAVGAGNPDEAASSRQSIADGGRGSRCTRLVELVRGTPCDATHASASKSLQPACNMISFVSAVPGSSGPPGGAGGYMPSGCHTQGHPPSCAHPFSRGDWADTSVLSHAPAETHKAPQRPFGRLYLDETRRYNLGARFNLGLCRRRRPSKRVCEYPCYATAGE